MSLLQLVVNEGKPCNGPLRFRLMPEGGEMEVLPTDARLPQSLPGQSGTDQQTTDMASETETVIVLTLKHKGPLPDGFKEAIEGKAYDWCNGKGVLAIPEVRLWYALEVREQK